jgi:ABC-type polysaccharide/polyol phosphate export permease
MSSLNSVDNPTKFQDVSFLDSGLSSKAKSRQKAFKDFINGLMMWKVWLQLAWQDISIRYRRSMIGPLWITLSMAITVYSMGFLYARLFHMKLESYFPYLVSGMLAWGLVQSILTEGVDAYLIASSLIRQVKLPYSFHIHRLVVRNFIIAGHNLLVMIPIYLWFSVELKWYFSFVLVFNLGLVYLNAFLVTNILALICARYRDLGQVFKSILQVLFFLTPVMWDPSLLPLKYQKLILLNPLYDFIQLVRQPLIGFLPSVEQYFMVMVYTLLGLAVNVMMFTRYRSRIVYWL